MTLRFWRCHPAEAALLKGNARCSGTFSAAHILAVGAIKACLLGLFLALKTLVLLLGGDGWSLPQFFEIRTPTGPRKQCRDVEPETVR